MDTQSSGDRRCFDSDNNSTSLEVGRQTTWFSETLLLLIAVVGA
jgi:hypothetical protein